MFPEDTEVEVKPDSRGVLGVRSLSALARQRGYNDGTVLKLTFDVQTYRLEVAAVTREQIALAQLDDEEID